MSPCRLFPGMERWDRDATRNIGDAKFTLMSMLPRFSKIKPPTWSSSALVFSETWIFIAWLRNGGNNLCKYRSKIFAHKCELKKKVTGKSLAESSLAQWKGKCFTFFLTFASAFHPRRYVDCVTWEVRKVMHNRMKGETLCITPKQKARNRRRSKK